MHKYGSHNVISNYRPITPTRVTSKLLEHITFSKTMNYFESHNIVYQKQHGFGKSFSYETQLFQVTCNTASNLDKRVQTDAIFINFSKAFDSVPHKRLINKLIQLNIHPALVTWTSKFLTNRTQCTVINSHSSSCRPVVSGVPLGPLVPVLILI